MCKLVRIIPAVFILAALFLTVPASPAQAAEYCYFVDSDQSLGNLNSFGVALGDVDGDGDLDAFVANYSNQDNEVWLNDGNGTFTDSGQSLGILLSLGVALGDVDGDGDLDAFVTNFSDLVVQQPNKVWLNNGSGTFTDSGQSLGDLCSYGVILSDIDEDGDLDAFVANFFSQANKVWLNNGSGNFTDSGQSLGSSDSRGVVLGDIDGDGDLDAFVANDTGQPNKVWLNNGSGTFTDGGQTLGASDSYGVALRDVDGDGDLDAFIANDSGANKVWRNDVIHRSAYFPQQSVVSTSADGARAVYATDVDGDGDLDLTSASTNDDTIAWYENDGSQNFTAHTVSTLADGAKSVYATDLDGDGDIDLMSPSDNLGYTTWYENTTGDGSAWTKHTVSTSADYPDSVYAADVDGDGDIDLMSASPDTDRVAWYENTASDGTAWTEHNITTSADGAKWVYAADVDGDGDIDLMSASAIDNKIAWYENLGGQFALATTDTAPASLLQGQADDLLKVTTTHKGRTGDADMELATLELLFEESAGDNLTTAEANAIIENLLIYLDDGSGVFEYGSDTLVTTVADLSLSAGTQTVTFTNGDANVQVAYGTPRTYFVVAELTSDAASQTPNQFRITHLTESSSTAEDMDIDKPLTLEYIANVPSGVMTATIPPLTVGGDITAIHYFLTTDLLGKQFKATITYSGRVMETVTVTSPDGRLTITIPKGTIARDKNGNGLRTFEATVNESPPPPPGGANIIGLAYNFGLPGTTFAPPITLTFSYDPADIPEGVAEEDLVLAYYDEDAGQWVTLECVVDTVNHTITAQVSHFTTFAVIGAITPPAPAAFSLSNLSIQPAQVQSKEAVTITVSVANTGGTEGSYSLVLKINEAKEAEKSVTVAAGSSQSVSFSVTREEAGSYSVVADGLSGSFTVVAPPPPTPTPTPTPVEEGGINWYIVGAILGVAVLLAILLPIWTRRRRAG